MNTENQQKYLKIIHCPGKSKKKEEVKKKLEAITGISKLEPYELRAIECTAKALNQKLYLFIQIIKYTGMRRSEALGLKWTDATKDGLVVVRQLKGIRDIPMIRQLKDVLLRHRAEQELIKAEVGDDAWENPDQVITDEIGGYIDPNLMTKWFRVARWAADITQEKEICQLPEDEQKEKVELFKEKKITPHVVRHYYSSFLNHVGIDKKVIMSLMGHANMEFTDERYIHLFPESIKQAAKVFEKALDIFEGLEDD